jgi:hypothetical protein
MAVVAANSDMS